MKEVQNKNHTDEAKRLNEELDQNLKDLPARIQGSISRL